MKVHHKKLPSRPHSSYEISVDGQVIGTVRQLPLRTWIYQGVDRHGGGARPTRKAAVAALIEMESHASQTV